MLPGILKLLFLALALYLVLIILLWRFQDRVAFPGPRAAVPEPREHGFTDGQRIELKTSDGIALRGWYLPPPSAGLRSGRAPALIWFYGNGETVAWIAPVAAGFRPPQFGLLLVDYRGYGESDGRTTEEGIYLDAAAAWDFLAARPDIDPARIAVYGRSLGSAPALFLATSKPVRAVVLESPFSSAREMARRHYRFLPTALVRISMDNRTRAEHLAVPLLVFHGTRDRLTPFSMGQAIAKAGRGRLVEIEGAGHNETYSTGGERYRQEMQAFLENALKAE